MNFPQNLKDFRLEKSKKTRTKVTQVKLANDLGLTRSMIASYEQGIAEPSLCMIVKMAKYFDVKVDELLGD